MLVNFIEYSNKLNYLFYIVLNTQLELNVFFQFDIFRRRETWRNSKAQ